MYVRNQIRIVLIKGSAAAARYAIVRTNCLFKPDRNWSGGSFAGINLSILSANVLDVTRKPVPFDTPGRKDEFLYSRCGVRLAVIADNNNVHRCAPVNHTGYDTVPDKPVLHKVGTDSAYSTN
ncbi:hypothetical protein F6P93_12685 [Escherichia coli]|nr:hypothetical protein F6P93_12685 [Escherichia coli]